MEHAFSGSIVSRLVLTLLVISIAMLYQLLRDYSRLFPKEMKGIAYFDLPALIHHVSSLSDEDRTSLRIESEWQTYSSRMFDHWNQLIQVHAGGRAAPVFANQDTIGRVKMQYDVKRTYRSIQSYQVTDASAEVTYELSRVNDTALPIQTIITMMHSRSNHISLTFTDIFWKRCKISQVKSVQRTSVLGAGLVDIGRHTDVFFIKFLPIPAVHWSLLLAELEDVLTDEEKQGGKPTATTLPFAYTELYYS